MSDQRIIKQTDGWHFRIRGGNTIGPFSDATTAELALVRYRERWQQRTDTAPARWRNWRRAPSPLATKATAIHEDAVAAPAAAIDSPPLQTNR